MTPGLQQLKHIVVLMMENRSFDHMLGYLKAQDPRIDGLNGSESNPDTNGAAVKVQPNADYQGQLQPDPGHHFEDTNTQIFGNPQGTRNGPTMQGFIKSRFRETGRCFSFAEDHAVLQPRSSPRSDDARTTDTLSAIAGSRPFQGRHFPIAPSPTSEPHSEFST